ncbi:coiled-coil domain-containing protein 110 [Tiliqua scincoides]|uniref:coiled-coil domain-containing protein 110 n=1 Tax=Tiliqua scincoides TaxID=71010 RepID=UPI003462F40A
MRAALGYSEWHLQGGARGWEGDGVTNPGCVAGSPECDRRSRLSCGSLEEEEEEKIVPSLLALAGGQDKGAADRFVSGRDDHVQSHSALKILQQQLESFQTFRQQTLQNVNMVQSEIREILNKSITDLKSPENSLKNTLLTSTPVNSDTLRECQENSHYKKQLHLDKMFGTSQSPEMNSGTTLMNTMTDEDTPHQVLLKYKATEEAENHNQISRDKATLALSDDHKLKASTSRGFSPYFISLLTETISPPSEIKNYDVSKISTPFHKYGDEDNERLTESVSFSFKNMKEEPKTTSRHELPYAFEFQNSPSLLCGKDNDSGYLSEQDLTEKAADTSREDLKSNRISELKDSVAGVHIGLVSASAHNLSMARTESENKHQNKEFFMNGKLPLHFLPRVVEDELLIPECPEKREKDQRKQLLGRHQEFQKHEDVKFGDANAVSGDRCIRLLQMPLKETGYLQKKVIDLEHENADLRKQINPLTAIIQSLTEQNSKYQNQIRNLHDEKNDIQGKLIKSEGDCKECLKEVKRLVKKCKELQQQKLSLEEKQAQLYAQNQRTLRNLEDIQQKGQKAQESVAILIQEKGDLTVALEALEKQVSAFQEENNMLGGRISQLAENKCLLEQELGEKQNEIQQLKNHEKTAIADMEALLEMIQSLKNEKSNLDQMFQESLNAKEVLQKELEEAQTGRAHAEEKLETECKNAKMETGVLQIKLSTLEKECERLKTGVAVTTEENWFLKKDLNEHKQEASEWKNKIRRLSEELLLMENKMCSTENERDVLQFEVHRLQRNTTVLRDQLTTLVQEQYNKYNSGSRGQNYQPEHFTETCEEISSYQHFSFIHIPPECEKIVEIRRKLEEELCILKRHSNITQLYSTLSDSCTTSVISQASFQTAAQKKYGALCSAI